MAEQQELPANAPGDPTETTLEQPDASVSADGVLEAQAKRAGTHASQRPQRSVPQSRAPAQQAQAQPAQPQPGPEDQDSDVPDGTAEEVLDWVGDDPGRARRALRAEEEGRQRSSLSSKLERIAEG